MSDDTKATGRPSSFRPEYVEQVRKLCMLGATDKDLADFFGVSETTVNNWKIAHPEFLESLKSGKVKADALVAYSLYHRAIGYKHDAVKILAVARGGNAGSDVEEVPYVEHYPPDTTAAIFWLKNRRPDLWRDKQVVESEVTVKAGVLAVPMPVDAEQWGVAAVAQQHALVAHPPKAKPPVS